MALLKIYALRDVRSEAFNRPMFMQNKAVLDRAIRDACNDENSLLHHHPEDYQVYYLGTFDESTGKIESQPAEHMFNVIEKTGAEQ